MGELAAEFYVCPDCPCKEEFVQDLLNRIELMEEYLDDSQIREIRFRMETGE